MRFAFRRASPLAFALAASLLAGCASPPVPVPAPEPIRFEASPAASIRVLEPAYRDQYRLTLTALAKLANPRSSELRLESASCSLAIEGMAAPLVAEARPLGPIPAGASAELRFEFPVDARELACEVSGPEGPPEAAFRVEARARLAAADGRGFDLEAAGEGSFPIIREPRFTVKSVRIERDILVTTNLELGIEIENPNAFPLEFRSFDGAFYGEGRKWAASESSRQATVPARGSSGFVLYFTMNFADMDRRLFDLVATLKTVRYRLEGVAGIATGLPFLPEFPCRFDLSGSCLVER